MKIPPKHPVTVFFIGITLTVSLSAFFPTKKEMYSQQVDSGTSYEGTVKQIIDNNCITCHAGDEPAGGFHLTTYEMVRYETEHGDLLKRINDKKDPMPQGGLMTLELRQAIETWAAEGYIKERTKDEEIMEEFVFNPPQIDVVPVDENVFGFFNLMKGHWIGDINIMGQKYDWFAFDYRPISESHIHGIYEGGSIGNLFTSFFIADFKGTTTIMARNGGILNGIYRTSYFVLDEFKDKGGEKYFRLVDAYGGSDIMWMELTFKDDEMRFNSYTSRFGSVYPPKQHMKFKAKRNHLELANHAAEEVNYPTQKVAFDFSEGLPQPDWGHLFPTITSASYIHQVKGDIPLIELGKLAGDPWRVDQLPYLSVLDIELTMNDKIKDKKLLLYLSHEPLSNDDGSLKMEYGYLSEKAGNSILLFPNIKANQEKFTFYYLHPGDYYVTVVADMDNDEFPSAGDVSSKSIPFSISPENQLTVNVDKIDIQN